jgi:hypothetical protein
MQTKPMDEDDVIERLDDGVPPSSPEEALARAPYERLFERIRDLEDIEPPAGWKERAVARWLSSRDGRPRRRDARLTQVEFDDSRRRAG